MIFSKQQISLNKTNLFSTLFLDYINQSVNITSFYKHHINKKDFSDYLENAKFGSLNREVLVNALHKQSALVKNTSQNSTENIDNLNLNNTYTVTTGHQLCLFTGPLYFIYKIASTINLCKTLAKNFPPLNFVPIYWMASEDHDFEEINHANIFGKKVTWDSHQKGCVGEFSTEGLQLIIAELKNILGESEKTAELISIFENAYVKHSNLADATRYLVNELFGEYGIVILDGNDADLKRLFKEEFKKDIFENISYQLVSETITELEKKYSTQVTPREINIFYKEKGVRERIEKQGEYYAVLNTDIKFTAQEIETIIETTPEKLSPNVVLRPLYQQKILPNIAYVGGPGELAYWLEYKTMFESFKINLPILMPRNFATVIDKTTQLKLQKLNITIEDVFKDGEELVKQFIKTQHNDINLEEAKQKLVDVYSQILETVTNIDKSLVGTTEAEKQKATNGITTIEQKINRALKQKSETDVNQIWSIKDKLFPKGAPQERYDNFSMYYSKYGKDFIIEIMNSLNYNLTDFEYTLLLEN
jgi:bacillithiol synthase